MLSIELLVVQTAEFAAMAIIAAVCFKRAYKNFKKARLAKENELQSLK